MSQDYGSMPDPYVRIGRLVLSLDTFTVENLQKITGLNPERISQELAKLQEEGFLQDTPEDEPYKAVEDLEKRRQLAYRVL